MRPYFLIAVLLANATPAFAQSYPQEYPVQQEANVANYAAVPTAYPQTYDAAPAQQQPMHQQPVPAPIRATDAGQSVVMDIRQMNF